MRRRAGDSIPSGGNLLLSCMHRLGSFLLVQNFEFQYVRGFLEKIIFFGYEDFVDIFGVITKLVYI